MAIKISSIKQRLSILQCFIRVKCPFYNMTIWIEFNYLKKKCFTFRKSYFLYKINRIKKITKGFYSFVKIHFLLEILNRTSLLSFSKLRWKCTRSWDASFIRLTDSQERVSSRESRTKERRLCPMRYWVYSAMSQRIVEADCVSRCLLSRNCNWNHE